MEQWEKDYRKHLEDPGNLTKEVIRFNAIPVDLNGIKLELETHAAIDLLVAFRTACINIKTDLRNKYGKAE